MCAPPPGFSQLAAPFIASTLQGIRRGPMFRLTILPLLPAHLRARTAPSFKPIRGPYSLLPEYFTFFPSLVISNISKTFLFLLSGTE